MLRVAQASSNGPPEWVTMCPRISSFARSHVLTSVRRHRAHARPAAVQRRGQTASLVQNPGPPVWRDDVDVAVEGAAVVIRVAPPHEPPPV